MKRSLLLVLSSPFVFGCGHRDAPEAEARPRRIVIEHHIHIDPLPPPALLPPPEGPDHESTIADMVTARVKRYAAADDANLIEMRHLENGVNDRDAHDVYYPDSWVALVETQPGSRRWSAIVKFGLISPDDIHEGEERFRWAVTGRRELVKWYVRRQFGDVPVETNADTVDDTTGEIRTTITAVETGKRYLFLVYRYKFASCEPLDKPVVAPQVAARPAAPRPNPSNPKRKPKPPPEPKKPPPTLKPGPPRSPEERAASLLKQARELDRRHVNKDARAYYERVVKEYPGTPAAKEAGERLATLPAR